MDTLAVVLIFAHKPSLEWFEATALRQCVSVLARHPIHLVCPEGMDVTAYRRIAPDMPIDFIAPRWLCSVAAYNRLKVLPFLYRRYRQFEYMLTHELDAFVFRDELSDWCARGYDYIGAPWFEGFSEAGPDARVVGVGNSGFSLRRIASCLRVGKTFMKMRPTREIIREWRVRGIGGPTDLLRVARDVVLGNNFFGSLNGYRGHEDFFWCNLVPSRFPWFHVAPYEIARRFAFEANPARLYRECGNTLPFGCHQWRVYEPEFWQSKVDGLRSPRPTTAAPRAQG